jgi:hypothetical protein
MLKAHSMIVQFSREVPASARLPRLCDHGVGYAARMSSIALQSASANSSEALVRICVRSGWPVVLSAVSTNGWPGTSMDDFAALARVSR